MILGYGHSRAHDARALPADADDARAFSADAQMRGLCQLRITGFEG